jgi:DNA-binding NarL/FixJ family response regulator
MRPRIVIVDDNAQILEAAQDLLQRQGAEVVAVASNGLDAHRLVRELRPDCVLVDVELGAESGFDVATRLVADYGQCVVLISVYSETEFADRLSNSPAIGFIRKLDLSVERIIDVLDGRGSAI